MKFGGFPFLHISVGDAFVVIFGVNQQQAPNKSALKMKTTAMKWILNQNFIKMCNYSRLNLVRQKKKALPFCRNSWSFFGVRNWAFSMFDVLLKICTLWRDIFSTYLLFGHRWSKFPWDPFRLYCYDLCLCMCTICDTHSITVRILPHIPNVCIWLICYSWLVLIEHQ